MIYIFHSLRARNAFSLIVQHRCRSFCCNEHHNILWYFRKHFCFVLDTAFTTDVSGEQNSGTFTKLQLLT